MRKTRLFFAVIACGLMTGTLLAADQMTVQVKKTQLRDAPSYLGRLVAELRFGDRVTVLEKGPAWLKVQPALAPTSGEAESPESVGYLHKSSLTTRQLTLTAGTATQVNASEDEMALAGSGFNEEVEQNYRKVHPNLSAAFAALDRLERSPIFNPDSAEVQQFLATGGVDGGER